MQMGIRFSTASKYNFLYYIMFFLHHQRKELIGKTEKLLIFQWIFLPQSKPSSYISSKSIGPKVAKATLRTK